MADTPGSDFGDGQATRRPAFLAAALLGFSGVVNIAGAPAAIAADPYYVLIAGDLYRVDFTGWAWLRLAVGVATVLAALALVANWRWGARVGLVAAGLGAFVAVLGFSYSPLHTILVVPLNLVAVRLIRRRR
jgi:hypothetical protein